MEKAKCPSHKTAGLHSSVHADPPKQMLTLFNSWGAVWCCRAATRFSRLAEALREPSCNHLLTPQKTSLSQTESLQLLDVRNYLNKDVPRGQSLGNLLSISHNHPAPSDKWFIPLNSSLQQSVTFSAVNQRGAKNSKTLCWRSLLSPADLGWMNQHFHEKYAVKGLCIS